MAISEYTIYGLTLNNDGVFFRTRSRSIQDKHNVFYGVCSYISKRPSTPDQTNIRRHRVRPTTKLHKYLTVINVTCLFLIFPLDTKKKRGRVSLAF